jgi:hypothetical protein
MMQGVPGGLCRGGSVLIAIYEIFLQAYRRIRATFERYVLRVAGAFEYTRFGALLSPHVKI